MEEADKKRKVRTKNNVMMSQSSLDNLIPFNKRPVSEQRRIQSLGGKALKNNPTARIANRLRWLKEKGMTEESSRWLYNMMTDSEIAAMQILEYIQKLMKSSDKNQDVNAAVKTAMDWFKIKHGTKENDSKHLITVVKLTPEQKEEQIYRLIGTNGLEDLNPDEK